MGLPFASGAGSQARTVACLNTGLNTVVADAACYISLKTPKPPTTVPCFSGVCAGATFAYYTSAFSACNVTCGTGVQTRSVQCLNGDGVQVELSSCGTSPPASAMYVYAS